MRQVKTAGQLADFGRRGDFGKHGYLGSCKENTTNRRVLHNVFNVQTKVNKPSNT